MLTSLADATDAVRLFNREASVAVVSDTGKRRLRRKAAEAMRKFAEDVGPQWSGFLRDGSPCITAEAAPLLAAKAGEVIALLQELNRKLPGTFDDCAEVYEIMSEMLRMLPAQAPAPDRDMIDAARRHYEAGTLMDTETFFHAVRGH